MARSLSLFGQPRESTCVTSNEGSPISPRMSMKALSKAETSPYTSQSSQPWFLSPSLLLFISQNIDDGCDSTKQRHLGWHRPMYVLQILFIELQIHGSHVRIDALLRLQPITCHINYRHPLPEHVYDVYMKYWRDINLMHQDG